MRAGAPYGTTRKLTKFMKVRSGTKKALRKTLGKKETYVATMMDVESPATCKGTLTLKDDKDALEGWGAMDEEETIVPKEFLKGPRDLPDDYTPPTIHKVLFIHGSSINEGFILPPNIEVVIFSRRGNLLWTGMFRKMLAWIKKSYAELMNSDMEKYHLKTFIRKGCKGPGFVMKNAKEYTGAMKTAEETFAEEISQSYPQYSTSRRYNPFGIFTTTIQIFRGGRPCPNILLQNDELGGKGFEGDAGFWDIGKKGEGDVVIPLKKDDISTESLVKELPFPKQIPLEMLLNDDAFRNGGRIRLYLFCCRVEEKGQEASNSQASDASQPGKVYINKYGELTYSRSKKSVRSKGKRSLFSRYKRRR